MKWLLFILFGFYIGWVIEPDAPNMDIYYQDGEYVMKTNISQEDRCAFLMGVFQVYCVEKTEL